MTIDSRLIVFPEGDTQEIPHTLQFNQVVDINGNPLRPPLPTVKMIAYRVNKISTRESIGESTTLYYLSLLKRDEMTDMGFQ